MNTRTTHRDARPPGRDPTVAGPPWRRFGDHEASLHAAAGDVRADLQYLTAQGFQPTEAGNLTAYLIGLAPVERGWTVDEIERLLFTRHLFERRHIKS